MQVITAQASSCHSCESRNPFLHVIAAQVSAVIPAKAGIPFIMSFLRKQESLPCKRDVFQRSLE